MTTGNKVSDSRYSAVFGDQSCFSTSAVTVTGLGSYLSKSWNGSNSPKTPKRPFTLDRYSYPIYNKKGAFVKMRYRIVKRYGPQGPRPSKVENPYSCQINRFTDSAVQFVRYNCGPNDPFSRRHNWQSSASWGVQNSNIWTANDDIGLLGKLRDKIFGEGFNMLVFLGEGRESLQTITESARRITQSFKFLKQGRVGAAAETLLNGKPRKGGTKVNRKQVTEEWLASNWLQLKYGWEPLVNDIYAAAAHFAYMQHRDQTQVFVRGAHKNWVPKSLSTGYTHDGFATFGKRIKAKITRINKVAALGLTNPASLVWEKLPYSFVFDWVIPLGAYLDALNLDRSLTGLYVISSKLQVGVNVFTQVRSVPNPGVDYSIYNPITAPRTYIDVNRTVSTSLSVPLPQVKPWEKVTSFIHCVNALALMTNAAKGPIAGVRY
ncbi:TPA_asm: maturation protein [ssRNA phage Gerhypos.4_13]|uniref:Maturation protein n=2 Tax=Fiersviridae TaxID=2842319 RepID=A0A8S5KXP7_9VIRU|nr:maturation protein [ssRNA phage Gerhypos.4_13]QDH91503.1 MAG: hypothetical protein H4Bulk46380_000002 [Leviviridae sp.]DAD50542.1 TPA_asm: maturation protein [ssRNA phage Gerhypos.4_13]